MNDMNVFLNTDNQSNKLHTHTHTNTNTNKQTNKHACMHAVCDCHRTNLYIRWGFFFTKLTSIKLSIDTYIGSM